MAQQQDERLHGVAPILAVLLGLLVAINLIVVLAYVLID